MANLGTGFYELLATDKVASSSQGEPNSATEFIGGAILGSVDIFNGIGDAVTSGDLVPSFAIAKSTNVGISEGEVSPILDTAVEKWKNLASPATAILHSGEVAGNALQGKPGDVGHAFGVQVTSGFALVITEVISRGKL